MPILEQIPYDWKMNCATLVGWLVGCVLRPIDSEVILKTAPPFTVPCEGREARLIHRSHRELNPRPSCGSQLQYRCATQIAPRFLLVIMFKGYTIRPKKGRVIIYHPCQLLEVDKARELYFVPVIN